MVAGSSSLRGDDCLLSFICIHASLSPFFLFSHHIYLEGADEGMKKSFLVSSGVLFFVIGDYDAMAMQFCRVEIKY